MWDSIKPSRRQFVALASVFAVASAAARSSATTTTSTWTGATSTLWSNAANWSPNTADPSNGNAGVSDYNVIIGAPSPTLLDISVTIDTLTLNAGAHLQTNGGTTRTVNGPTLTDNGIITINANVANAGTTLTFGANTTLSGSGSVILTTNGNPATSQINTALNVVLTQASGHTISGNGELNAALINNGTVNANSTAGTAALLLESNPMTNNSLFEATAGGTLQISGNTVTQGPSGQLLASNGTVSIINGTISGGTLNSALGGTIQTSGTSTLDSLTNNATLNVLGGATTNITGNLVDTGLITVNSNIANAGTVLSFNGGTLSGNGTISLSDNGNLATSQLNGSLTQSANHTISGHGVINAALTNNGVINANATAGSAEIVLQSSAMTNNLTFEATSNGTLAISGITVTQSAPGQLLAANGTVAVINSTISGGTLNSSGTGTILVSGTSSFTTLTNAATLTVVGGSVLNLNGTITDNATLSVNNGANAGTSLTSNGATLTGTGTLLLLDNANGNNARIDGTLTQTSGHTITGHGNINANLTNAGIVNANVSGTQLNILSPVLTNTNILEATGGGLLVINNASAVNNAGGQINANGGNVTITGNAAVTGGSLSTGPSSFIDFANVNLNGVTIAAGSNVNVDGGTNTNLNTSNLTNNGTITVNNTAANAGTAITVNSNLTITGTGSIVLDDNANGNNARIDTAANITLTQDAGHSITGHGNINASFINNGIVNANVANTTLILQTSNMTNNNLFEATAGTLNISSIAITQGPSGQIAASPGTVNLTNTSVSNGILNGSGLFQIFGTSTLTTLTTNAAIHVIAGQTLNINGNFFNNNTITVNDNQGNAATNISFNGGTLSGNTTIVLNDNGNGNNARIDGNVTQASTGVIQGHGNINAVFINNGIVNANVANTALTLQTNNMTNNNIFEATAGTLNVGPITVTQGPSAQIVASPGTVNFTNTTVSNGTLNGAGLFQIFGTVTLNTLTTNAAINVIAGQTLNINGNFVNNNTITVNDTQGNAATNISFNGGTLSGNSTIVLNDNGNGNNARIDGTLIQASTGIIQGHGNINAVFTNNGIVNANVANTTLTLQTNAMTNNNIFEATAGTLNITSIAITQGPSGQIAASPGTVNLINATISNGTLNGAGLFQIFGTSTLNTLTTNTAINVIAGQTLNINGNFVNNNTITVNDTQGNAATNVSFTGGTLSGTGRIVLNDNTNGNNARVDGTLTLGAGQTITGHGNINAALTNNGTVISNLTSTAINVNGVVVNNSLFRATNGGAINFAAGTVISNGTLNGAGTFQIDANSSMSIANPVPFTSAATIILTGPNATFTGLSSLATNTGNLTLQNGATATITGPITNAGIIFLNGANNTLTVTNGYTQTTGVINGNGTLLAGALFGNITAGSALIQVALNGAHSGTSKLTSLTITGNTSNWTGTLALNNNKLILETSNLTKANALLTLRNQAIFGLTHATGITTSNIPANFGIAVADNNALSTPFTTFGGQPVDTNSLLVSPELLGDTDLSGKVDLTDLSTVLNNFGSTSPAWTDGNFANGPTVDLTDLSDVLHNFGATNPNANTSNPFGETPEPTSLALLISSSFLLISRRNSSRRPHQGHLSTTYE